MPGPAVGTLRARAGSVVGDSIARLEAAIDLTEHVIDDLERARQLEVGQHGPDVVALGASRRVHECTRFA